MRRKLFEEAGRKGGKASGERKRRGDKAHYEKLGRRGAVARKWKGKLPAEAAAI